MTSSSPNSSAGGGAIQPRRCVESSAKSSKSFEHDYQLQLAAFDYELASRAEEGKPRYLLGKRFDELSYEQMCGVMDRWKRGAQASV